MSDNSSGIEILVYDSQGMPVLVQVDASRAVVLPRARFEAIWHCLTDAIRRSPSRQLSQAHRILDSYRAMLPPMVDDEGLRTP